ncbi:MAG TPA: AraC family transcriptional regulator [Bdellovibrio sp.]|uniref:AraC family transcriptional regulator n=1 Tax=Bdellovibrio sp. TaxID=28201 RepID=UPI002F09E4F8
MDILSDFIGLVRTETHLYGSLELSGVYGLKFPGLTGVFFIVNQGACFLSVADGPNIELKTGDFVFLPALRPFTLKSSRDVKKTSAIGDKKMKSYVETGKLKFDGDGGGASTSMIAGCFEFSNPESKLIKEYLPEVLHIKANDFDETPWTHAILRLISTELSQGRPGFKAAFNRLSEVLFIHAMRIYFTRPSVKNEPSWLRALNDVQVGKALKLMHANLGKSWTVTSLGKAVGLSKSGFAARFKSAVGQTPMEHLTQRRILKAARLLEESESALIEDVANTVGYESESAFRKAFRREMGASPRDFRSGKKESLTRKKRPSANGP